MQNIGERPATTTQVDPQQPQRIDVPHWCRAACVLGSRGWIAFSVGSPYRRHVVGEDRGFRLMTTLRRELFTTGLAAARRGPRGTREARVGTIERDQGVLVFSDSDAQGLGKRPQHFPWVRFLARDLCGGDVHRSDSVSVDLGDDPRELA